MSESTPRRIRRARDPERNSGPVWRLLQVVCVLTAVWLVFPTLVIVPISFTAERSYHFPPSGWSTKWYAEVLSSSEWLGAAWTSLWIGIVVALISAVTGTIAAIGLSRGRLIGRTAVNAYLLSPLIAPAVLLGVGTYLTFLKWGLIDNPWGFVLAHSAVGVPYVLVAAMASLRNADPSLERAAASLGARPIVVLLTVTLRLMLPGVLAGTLFAFVASFDEVIISMFLVGPEVETLPVKLFSSVREQSNPAVAAVSTLVLGFTTALLLVILYLQRKARR